MKRISFPDSDASRATLHELRAEAVLFLDPSASSGSTLSRLFPIPIHFAYHPVIFSFFPPRDRELNHNHSIFQFLRNCQLGTRLVFSPAGISRGPIDMDFIVPDLLSATPTATSDGPVRAARAASFSGPSARKSFSSVLQGVRGEEKKGNSQEADSPQGFDKVEDRPDPKQAKGLNSAASQAERSEARQARTSDSDESNDAQSQTMDGSGEESESASPQSNSGSAAEGRMVVWMASGSLSQTEAQMMLSEVQETHDGAGEIGREPSSSAESSPASVATDVPEQAQNSSLFLKGEPHVTQSAELGGTVGENGVTENAADSAQAHAAIQASPSGGTISSSDHNSARLVQIHDGELLPGGQLARGENGVAHHSTDDQAPLFVPAHEGQGDAGQRTQWITPHGQQLVVDQEELFSQSGHEHDGRQQGDPETKLFQMMAVDLPSMNGRTTEQYAAVTQSQTISAPTAPSSTVVVPPAQPASSAPDLTQPLTPSILRSVVLEVDQPELGHVNIRVAMMNESVHAHFSTDRVEVGQFLINGQDRLQTMLQANGLDMGQFRVDIDRQSGGRSFQQGLFHEQGQSGHQGSQGGVKEQAHGWSDEMYRPLQGRLNVVA